MRIRDVTVTEISQKEQSWKDANARKAHKSRNTDDHSKLKMSKNGFS